MRLEFFRNSNAERDSWTFGKHDFPNRLNSYVFLDPPDGSSSTVKKVWKQRGYGLWPDPLLQVIKIEFEITQDQRNLCKSHIAAYLISQDAQNFARLGDKNHFKTAHFELAAENSRRLTERRQKIEKKLKDRVGSEVGRDIFVTVDEIVQKRVASFIHACKRTRGDVKVSEALIKDQVTLLVRDLHNINKTLPHGSDIMGIESLTALESRK